MSNFKNGDIVVHIGGRSGINSRNRGKVMTVLDGPLRIAGWTGQRYIVDTPVFTQGGDKATAYHANGAYLIKLR